VKAPAPGGGEQSLATGAGIAVGTPAYMAPEIAFGEEVDGRADLYALGCVAYFLLTGKTVFEADTALQMVAKHLQANPAPPSQRTEQEVPAALEAVVLSCLAKERNGRPQSAAMLARALRAVPMSPWTEDQANAWWQCRNSSIPTVGFNIDSANENAGQLVRR